MLISFCADSYSIWQLIGRILLVFKIVIPLLLIIFGMIDLGKAVIASDEKAISKSTQSIIRRLIAAVVIFFIPAIVGAIFSLISNFASVENDYTLCKNCITNPNKDSVCKDAAKRACTASGNKLYGASGQELKDSDDKSASEKFAEQCPDVLTANGDLTPAK